MQCGMCREEAVTFQQYSGKYLCRRHFIDDIEAKAKHAIRSRRWLKAGDHIGVDFSGDCASTVLLFFLHHLFSNRKDIRVTAVIIDEIHRECRGTERSEEFARGLGIPVVRGSFPARPGLPTGGKGTESGEPGTIGCREAMRSEVLDRLGKEHGMTKIASGYCLDDETVSLLTDMLRGYAGHLFVQPGDRHDRLPVITPFIAISEDDIALYAHERGIRPCGSSRCPGPGTFEKEVKTMLDTYTGRHPATKYSLLHLGMSIRNAGTAAGVLPGTSRRFGGPARGACPRSDEVTGIGR